MIDKESILECLKILIDQLSSKIICDRKECDPFNENEKRESQISAFSYISMKIKQGKFDIKEPKDA